MQKYQIYKSTNIKWMDRIPADWNEIPLRKIFEDIKNTNKNGDDIRMLSLVKDLGIIPYEDRGNQGNKSSEKLDKYKIVDKGDFVINKMNAVLGSLGISEYEGLVSPVYYVLRNRNEEDYISRYFELVFKTKSVQIFLRTLSKGIMEIRESVDWVELKNMSLPLPPKTNQIEIVELVNRIDRSTKDFIQKRQRYIELLKEYKQSKINELVTKGINPNVKMKDSKIEWLGMIPEKWDLKRLKLLLKKPLQYGANESGEKSANNSLRYIRITDFSNDNRLADTNKLYLPIEKGINYKLNENDLLFARSGATAGKVFICSNLLEESCFAGYLIRAVVNSDIIIPKYLYYFMHSSAYYNWISYTFIKSTIENISATKYESLNIPIPTINEQKNIMQIIDDIEIKYKNILLKVEQQIDLLQQYRQSMIYELVTGKRKP